MDANQSWIGDVAILSEKLHREAWLNTFWAKYGGFADISRDDNGNPRYSASGKPIEILEDFVQEGRDNMMLPLVSDLTGSPVFGDSELEGTGEEMVLKWMMVFINQYRKAVMQRSGQMAEQRELLLKLYNEALPQLKKWFSKYMNQLIFQTFYEGASENLTKSTAYDGLGLYKRYHPNWYYASGTGSVALTALGTEKSTKTAANITTASAAVYAATSEMTMKTLRAMRIKAMDLLIPQIVDEDSFKFWGLLIHPQTGSALKSDSEYYNAVNSAYSREQLKHPMLNGAVGFVEGFAIFEDIAGIRMWDDANEALFGSDFATFIKPSALTTANYKNRNSIVFGNQAIGKGVAKKLHFTKEINDHENTIEIGGAIIEGYNRIEHFAEADAGKVSGDAFYTNTTGGIASGLAALNQSSMIVMTYDE